MNLPTRVLQDFESYSRGAIDVELLQKRVEASVAAMDGSVPIDLREHLEKFVRDAEIARFTTGARELEGRIRELAEPMLIRLKAHVASRG
jgi:hypothetical protein